MRCCIFPLLMLTIGGGCASDRQISTIATDAKGRVGLCAQVIETGERIELHSADRFPMQSVYKLPIAMGSL